MDHEQYCRYLLETVKKQMNERRFHHTEGVAKTSRELARKFGADEKKAEIAGILHDYCKQWSGEKLYEVLQSVPDLPEDLMDFNKELWHAVAGAEVVRTELGITDEEILDAIRYHTTGRVNMGLLEKIVCLADYIEPGRKYPGLEEIRNKVSVGLNEALVEAFSNTICFLVHRKNKIYPMTYLVYNDLVEQMEKNEIGGMKLE